MFKPTAQQVAEAAKLTLQLRRCTLGVTSDQVRATIYRQVKQIVDGKAVTGHLEALFKRSPTKGYFVVNA